MVSDSCVDCTACGRVGVTFDEAINLCQRVHCPPFKHFQRIENRAAAHQHHIDSALEVATNILIGALVSLAAQALIFPAYGIHVSAGTHIGIVVAFTVVSVVRQYALRRLFNGKSPYRWMKEKWW